MPQDRIIFIRLGSYSSDGKKAFLTVDGQMLNSRTPLRGDLLVKAARGAESAFQRARNAAALGDYFFVHGIRYVNGCYEASDITPVSSLYGVSGDLNFNLDGRLEWERWKSGRLGDFHKDTEEVSVALQDLLDAFQVGGNVAWDAYEKLGIVNHPTQDADYAFPLFQAGDRKDGPSFEYSDDLHNTEQLAVSDMTFDDACSVYRSVVALLAEIRRTGYVIGPYRWAPRRRNGWLDSEKGDVYVNVDGNLLEEAMRKEGFEKNSHKFDSVQVRYAWLFKKGRA